MVSSTLCPAVHILGSHNVYSRAEGIADHYWPWAVFFLSLSFIFFFLTHFFPFPTLFFLFFSLVICCVRHYLVSDARAFPGRPGRPAKYAQSFPLTLVSGFKLSTEHEKCGQNNLHEFS